MTTSRSRAPSTTTPRCAAERQVGFALDLGRKDWVASDLAGVLLSDAADPRPILKRLVEARLAGYPGPWRRLGSALDALLDRADRRSLRVAARRALKSEDSGAAMRPSPCRSRTLWPRSRMRVKLGLRDGAPRDAAAAPAPARDWMDEPE